MCLKFRREKVEIGAPRISATVWNARETGSSASQVDFEIFFSRSIRTLAKLVEDAYFRTLRFLLFHENLNQINGTIFVIKLDIKMVQLRRSEDELKDLCTLQFSLVINEKDNTEALSKLRNW